MMKVTLGFFLFSLFFFCGSHLLLVFVRLCGDFYFPACSAREVSNCFVVLYIHIKRWTDGRARTFFYLPFATNRMGSFFFLQGKRAALVR
uniref:Putative secreted protein n=1 Tax=Ixodes ricinus TaxID=34613 RepID=A0A6B0U6T1_IXORI